MAQTYTDTNVNQLVINKLTKQEYNNLQQVSDDELYLVEEQVDSVVTQNSTNPVQSGAVYEAIQDIGGTINDGTTTFTKNNETIGTTSANQSVNKTIALPNDVMMCKMLENKALASYANPITRFKYIEDHGWVDMDRSNIQYNEGTGEWTGTFVSLDITEGEYYYDMDNDTVFVADENSEMQDVTSTVIIQGDANKLYCDVTDNKLYRYDGTNFISLTSESKTYTLSSNNENIRLADSDGQIQDLSLNTLINGLSIGNSEPQDDDYIISQYVNGGTTTTTYHRRPLSKFWNWIKTKLGIGTNDGTFLRKDGTWATPTDTKATVTTTGNGNAITSLTASNGALTATKGSTFLTSHQDISGKFDKSQLGYQTFLVTRNSSKDTNNYGYWAAMCNSSQTGSPTLPTSGVWWHILSMDWTGTDTTNWISQLALPTNQTVDKGVWYRCNDTASKAINSSTWHRLAEADSSGNAKNANTVNGLTVLTAVPANAKFTDTNTWRPIGTGATDAAAGNHTHSTSIATSSGTNQITLAASTKYAITAGGTSYVFTTPPNTNTTYSAGTGLSLSSTTFSVSYGTTAGTACQGNDSRLSNSRPASDVYAWAKASTKPSYTASEVGAMSSTTDSKSSTTWYNSRSGSFNCYKIGRIVIGYICLSSSAISLTAGSTICALPYTPSQSVYFPVQNADNYNGLMRIDANSAYIKAGTGNLGNSVTTWYGMFCYVATS